MESLDMNLPLTLPGIAKTERRQGVKAQITHDAIIDYILANPNSTHGEVGAAFNYTKGGIAVIINSDAFQARYAKRKTELIDPLVIAKVDERITGLAVQSMEILARKLEHSEDGNFALKVFETTSRAAGYGVAKPSAVQNNFVVHLPGPASSSAEWNSKFAAPDAIILKPQVDDAPSEAADA